jgi:hypothetical protein
MEMGEVAETSSHPINGKHGKLVVEADCQPKVPLSTYSPAKAHTDLRSRLTEECKCKLTEEDVDTKL